MKCTFIFFRNYTGPQKTTSDSRGSNKVNYTRASRTMNPTVEPDDDSHSKYLSDTKKFQTYERDIEDNEVI